jgi:hypothetical protein
MARQRCTASGERRSWSYYEWTTSDGTCPDCGSPVEVWVRGADLYPFAKAKAHKAPAGVTPSPYGHHSPDTSS